MRDDESATRAAEPIEYAPRRLREYGSRRVATTGDPGAPTGDDGTHNDYNQS
jgi:hypothetical protein